MEQVFAIGDIHGEYEMFLKILKNFRPDTQRLILIGDLNDRGPKSKDCWFLGMELVQKYQAIYLRGNHEQYFLEFMDNPEDWFLAIYTMVVKKQLKVYFTKVLRKSTLQQKL